MIRVGFVMSFDRNWVGGINYITNLLHAVHKLPQRRIEPVLIVPPGTPTESLQALPPWQVLRTALADPQQRVPHLARKLAERGLGCDFLMQRFLRAHRIDVLSHSDQLGPRASVPSIGWLADFQHRRMPAFFEPAEIAARDRGYARIARNCSTVLLSSSDAQRDLASFAPAAVAHSRVLRFVAGFAGGAIEPSAEDTLRARYGIQGPYFHLPNQFWAHKNHQVVIDALALLQRQGRPALVVCTGHTKDRRQPGHFDTLLQRASDQGVAAQFRVLGLVPYEDLAGLMHHSTALINPSLFEGWSTTVEESKSLGLRIVLSDIAVHREQAPERGIFFAPQDPAALADALAALAAPVDPGAEQCHRARARDALVQRFSDFGAQYQQIVLETVARVAA
jgi:glycosyltransferase involved in cell wall biosynthesis